MEKLEIIELIQLSISISDAEKEKLIQKVNEGSINIDQLKKILEVEQLSIEKTKMDIMNHIDNAKIFIKKHKNEKEQKEMKQKSSKIRNINQQEKALQERESHDTDLLIESL